MKIERITIDREVNGGPHILLHFGPTIAAECSVRHEVGPRLARAIEQGKRVDGVIEDLRDLLPVIAEKDQSSLLATLQRMGILEPDDMFGGLLKAPEILVKGYSGAGAAVSQDGLCVPQVSHLGHLDVHQLDALVKALANVTHSVRCQLAFKRDAPRT